jgi:hypothetical protein
MMTSYTPSQPFVVGQNPFKFAFFTDSDRMTAEAYPLKKRSLISGVGIMQASRLPNQR